MTMKVLVIGGAGFIGSHIVDCLLRRGFKVVVFDNFDDYYTGKKHNIAHNLKNLHFALIKANILDYGSLLKCMKGVDIVFHLAAQPGVRFSMRNPAKTVNVNVLGTLNVLKAAKEANIRRMIFASSSSVYGVPKYVPVDEGHPTNPISVYGMSKLAAEKLCLMYYELYKVPVVILRYHTVYGPRQRPDMAIHRWTRQIYEDKPVTIYGDGSQLRDFTFIEDVVEASIGAIEVEGIEGEIFNIGTSSTIRVLDVVKMLFDIIGRDAKLVFEPPKLGDVPCTYADISKARKFLGYKPKTSLKEGLKKFVNWFKVYGKFYKVSNYD